MVARMEMHTSAGKSELNECRIKCVQCRAQNISQMIREDVKSANLPKFKMQFSHQWEF